MEVELNERNTFLIKQLNKWSALEEGRVSCTGKMFFTCFKSLLLIARLMRPS